jgi:hypothetical protein
MPSNARTQAEWIAEFVEVATIAGLTLFEANIAAGQAVKANLEMHGTDIEEWDNAGDTAEIDANLFLQKQVQSIVPPAKPATRYIEMTPAEAIQFATDLIDAVQQVASARAIKPDAYKIIRPAGNSTVAIRIGSK